MVYRFLYCGWMLVMGLVSIQAEPRDIFPNAMERLQSMSPGPDSLESRIVPVEGQDFKEALEAKTLQNSTWSYSIQYQGTIPVEIKNGDVILAEFSIRTLASTAESGEAKTQLTLEQKGGEYKKSVEYDASAGKEWKKFQVPFVVKGVKGADFAPGEAQICFRLGYRAQTIQIGGVRILNYGKNYDISTLPATRIDYEGRDPKAPWRVAAQKRIEELRKAPLRVRVVDSTGKPVAGAAVDIQMKRHAFSFGSAVDLQFFALKTPDGQRYRQFVLDHFNQITPENDLKWSYWEWKVAKREETLQALEDLKKNGIRVHGHNLIWPGLRVSPVDIKSIMSDRAALDKRISKHFNEIMGQTRGMIDEWDVVNEPYAERTLLDLYGDGLVGEWFRLAHQIDPKPILYLNDYPNFMNKGDNTQHKDDFEKRIKEMQSSGVPIQGIGMQAHFGAVLCPPEAALKELDRFAKLGLPIQITEFDIDTMDEKVKSDYTRDFMTICFSHPAVIGFSCWGFWEGRHYKPSCALVYQNWSFTPWGQAWFDLMEKEWWTKAAGVTDANGTYQVRGFLGDYTVTVTLDGKKVVLPTRLEKNSPVLNAKLEN